LVPLSVVLLAVAGFLGLGFLLQTLHLLSLPSFFVLNTLLSFATARGETRTSRWRGWSSTS
jgi:hypothetical protein